MDAAPETHPACLPEAALLADVELRFGRASGPGGQHRNKTESAAFLLHRPTGLVGQATERRSQAENRRVALDRLRRILALEVRTIRNDQVSPLWAGRRRGTSLPCNPEHADYPALLAEALDVLAEYRWNPKAAGDTLGVSATQLVRLVADYPPAFERLNRERAALGLHPLKR